MFHFYNTFLNLFNIFSLFPGGIIIPLAGSCFLILSLLDLVHVAKVFDSTDSAILFPKYLPALWTAFFLHLSLMIKIHIRLTYFFVLGPIECIVISVY